MFKNNIFRLEPLMLVLLAVSLVFILTSCTVDCTVPDLITAINNANANPAHSTLHLKSGCVYTLTAVDNTVTSSFNGSTFDYGDNGLPQIMTPITINGNGSTIIRDGGAPDFRIFFIADTGELTLNDLTLDNGFANRPGSAFPSSGGAIYIDGSYLQTNNVTMQNNQAAFHGGAVFSISGGTAYINDSTIQDNEAPHGGGIFFYHGGLLSVDNSEILNNEATTSGGGLSLDYGAELIVNSSLITSNHAGRHGGGIFKDSGVDKLPTTITDTTFEDNSADWSGGGVFIWRTPLTISGSVFKDNHADEYGGGLSYQDHAAESVLITSTILESNSAGWDGGAIHFSGDMMSVNNCTIQNNTAVNGAGLHNGIPTDTRYISRSDTHLIITGGLVTENVATGHGGGAFNEAEMDCGEANFVANESATLGGGIHNTGELEVLGCNFDKNATGFDGGGISNYEITEIRGSTFTNNTSERGAGFATLGTDAEIFDSIFMTNTATDRGGAIFNMGPIPGASTMEIENCEIKENTALYGAGVATSLGDSKITSSIISGNKGAKQGGGIFNDGLFAVYESTFSENEASDVGGGIHNLDEISVQNSTFERNIAAKDGGGLSTFSTAVIKGSTFKANNASQGGGLASIGGDTSLINDTFSANTASNAGGGILNKRPTDGTTPGGFMQANFITVAFNNAASGGGIATDGGSMQIKNSIVALNLSGGDCFTTAVDFSAIGENIDSDSRCIGFTLKDDPLLDTLANYGGLTDTHALKPGSPAIDAAPDCTTVSGAAVSVDQRGQPRPGGPICDLGAYEDAIGVPLPKLQPCIYTAAINVFCRLGPDDSLYPVVDSFKAGQSALVIGISWDKVFVYVEGPINHEVCVVPATARFGTLTGDCEELEIISPPDVDENIEEEELGCTVYDQSGALVCVVPCPPDAKPGEPCTP